MGKVVTPVVALLIARRLSPEVFGMYAVLQSALVIADAFRDAGVAQIYLRDPKPIEAAYVALSVRLGLTLALTLALLAWPASLFYQRPEFAAGFGCAAIAMALNGLSTVPYVTLLRRGDFRRAGQAETVASVVSSLAMLAGVFAGLGFIAMAGQLVIRAVLFAALTQRWAPIRVVWSGPPVAAKTARTLTAVNLLWTAYSMGDQALVGKLIGLTAGGLFGTGKMLVQTADVLAKPILQTVNVAFAHRAADGAEVGKILVKALALFTIAVAPIYVVVALLAEPLVHLLLPASFYDTAKLLPALCVYGAAIYPGSFAGSALLMADRPDVALKSWLAGFAIVAVAIFALRARIDVESMAWIFAGGLVAVNASTLIQAFAHFKPSREGCRNLALGGVAVLVTGSLALGIRWIPVGDAGRLAIAAFLIPVAHALMVSALITRNPFDIFRVSGVKQVWRSL